MKSKTLKLTLKKKWFDMIASGIKKEEYRQLKPWILARLEGRAYDAIEFRNGYGPKAPIIRVEWLGWEKGFGRLDWGAGFDEIAIIRLGAVLEGGAVCVQP